MLLRERILQTLEKQDNIDQRKLARIAGLSEPSLSKFLHGYEEAIFDAVFRMVKHLYPDEEVNIMAEYVLTQKSRNARFALEYCVLNNLSEELNLLIEKLSNSVNPLDKEWAAMYSLIREKREIDLSPYDFLSKVEVFKPKELEMRTLKAIVKGYVYYDLHEYKALVLHIKHAEKQIKEIKNDLIRESFKLRIEIILSTVNLLGNNLEKARYYSKAIIRQNLFEQVKGRAYNQLGFSYMYEDYQKASRYFEKALEYFINQKKENDIKNTHLNLSFLKLYWRKVQNYTLLTDDYDEVTNYIFFLIQNGKKSTAEQYLNRLNPDDMSDYNKAFHWYYKGLISRDPKDFYRSVSYFMQVNNYFHLLLPYEELRKLGKNDEFLQMFFTKGRSKDRESLVHFNN